MMILGFLLGVALNELSRLVWNKEEYTVFNTTPLEAILMIGTMLLAYLIVLLLVLFIGDFFGAMVFFGIMYHDAIKHELTKKS